MMGIVTFRWLTVFLDFPAPAFEPGVTFWREVTGYGLSPLRGDRGQFATLLPPSGDAYLRVQRVLDDAGGCHLDLHADATAQSLDEVAARAARLGATVRHRDPDGGLVIADSPGGFTFCLVRWHAEATVPGALVTGGGASRVDTLCIDVPPQGFERECAFWSALTGWAIRPARVAGYSYLDQPAGLPVHVLLQRLDDAEPGQRVRGHLDVGCADREALARHEALGARVAGAHQFWTILADPAGHPYCLVDRES
jgi:Glyoxalase-like domain